METTDCKQIQSVRILLLHEMQEGIYRYSERLPRENVLAERLNISRTQLRDSLAQLEREGFITRRHGVGTIINRHVLAVKVRMDMEIEFSDMIVRSGHTPGILSVKTETLSAGRDIAARFGLSEDADMLCVSRLVGADGKPAIYCRDYIPFPFIRASSYTQEDLHAPIFSFLKRFCGCEPYMDITEISPAVADAELARLFQVPAGEPLLFMDELDYDIQGMPILYSPQYYIGGVIRHTLMRKKF